ncbi:MAG: glycosyltransferase family protein [Emcibacter sp.]|nr:glycosyltransferase family protein [Emcibacter sp.]
MMDNILCISQARMTSTRLPGKIMKQVCGRTLLDFHVSRILKSHRINRFVLAITTNASDDPLEKFCIDADIDYIRGSEDDVLARYYQALQEFPADIIVRVTSDCPLIDPDLMDQVIQYYRDHRERYDYITLGPINFPRGLDVEVFSARALEKAYLHGHEMHQREHVTPYIYRENSEFSCGVFPSDHKLGHHRWCVDEPEDFDLITKILTAFKGKDNFSWQECLTYFDSNPDWMTINSAIKQKSLKE